MLTRTTPTLRFQMINTVIKPRIRRTDESIVLRKAIGLIWGVLNNMELCDAKCVLTSVSDDMLYVIWVLEGEYSNRSAPLRNA